MSTKWGLIRQGGDDDTPYNWTIDYSNSGADYCYFQGKADNGDLAGRYTDSTGDTIPAALAKGEAFLATIPILDFVAASYDRNTGWDTTTSASDVCPASSADSCGRSGVQANVADKFSADPGSGSALEFAYVADGGIATTGSPAFVANTMAKGSPLCSCAAGSSTCSGCSVSLNPVAQDEFVNFIKSNYGTSTTPVFFDLDNEPNYWIGTHPEIYPNDCSKGSVPWDDVVTRNTNAAKAVKAVWPSAKVFGPVVSGDGMAYGGDYNSPDFVAGTEEFSDYYLQKMAANSAAAGSPLIDVFDVHYYTVGSKDADCLEAPRLFWDPNATDISATATNAIDFQYGDHDYWDKYWYPRVVIPRLQKKIAAAYSGQATMPGLSFSEYNAGCETDLAGGIAEADLLGIFGREGVFAATAWPLKNPDDAFLLAAYDLYRNYDGSGSVVGDTAVLATTSDTRTTSVYAFADSGDDSRLDIVAINKNPGAQSVTINIAHAPTLSTVSLYQLAGSRSKVAAVSSGNPAVTCSGSSCTATWVMAAMSATTIILR